MWKPGLSAIVLGLLATGVGGHSADAAERRCEFRFDHEKPAWVADLTPYGKQRLIDILAQISVLERMDAAPPQNYSERCGCYMDHVDWEALRAAHPQSYFNDLMLEGSLPTEFQRLSKKLLKVKSAYRQNHCL